jgi:hypothetical protein
MFRNILWGRVHGHWEGLWRRIYISNTHFAKNDIIRVAIVEEVEYIGSLSSYVKYFLKFQAALHKLVPRCNFDSPYKNMCSMFYTSPFATVIWKVYGWTESQPYVA